MICSRNYGFLAKYELFRQALIKNILSIPAETQTIEFKRLGESRNDVVDRTLQSIVAMANTEGGTIILGVDDPEKTTRKGVDRIFGIEENLELYDEIGKSVRKNYPCMIQSYGFDKIKNNL